MRRRFAPIVLVCSDPDTKEMQVDDREIEQRAKKL